MTLPQGLSRLAAVIRLLLAFVVAAVLVGVVAAGLALPAVGATGAAARRGVQLFDTLPGALTQTPLSQQSRILAADGSLIATPSVENRQIVALSQVSTVMQQAQIDIEDSRFYTHGGVDLHGIARALVANSQGHSVQGASTLTQQYVKVTLQENAIRDGLPGAKARTEPAVGHANREWGPGSPQSSPRGLGSAVILVLHKVGCVAQ